MKYTNSVFQPTRMRVYHGRSEIKFGLFSLGRCPAFRCVAQSYENKLSLALPWTPVSQCNMVSCNTAMQGLHIQLLELLFLTDLWLISSYYVSGTVCLSTGDTTDPTC